MDERTRSALDKSIAHWRENENAQSLDEMKIFGHDCALCAIYVDRADPDALCHGCPVMERTGHDNCAGSPWPDVHRAKLHGDFEEALTHATKMREFLEGLLPAEEQRKVA